MVTDCQTNFVYISALLQTYAPGIYTQLTDYFRQHAIAFAKLVDAKDIWVVDFMPVQIHENEFVLFQYNPTYLQSTELLNTISDQQHICNTIGINTRKSNIVLDGGNVIRGSNKAIITDRIFYENHGYNKEQLIAELKDLLQVDSLIVIPKEPYDSIGHADGMIRFINDNTVLINQYPSTGVYVKFRKKLIATLQRAGLTSVEFPYTALDNKDPYDATGCYINYIEVAGHIFCPQFNQPEDLLALETLQKVFPQKHVAGIYCNELSVKGGVLNCATWNIFACTSLRKDDLNDE